jgi:molecular chaperone GrpE
VCDAEPCHNVTQCVLANKLTFAGGMNSEELNNEELVDNGNETGTDTGNEGNAEEHWPVDEEIKAEDSKLKEEQEKYLRLYSEFENFRRRTAKERLELLETAGKSVIAAILPVLDDFERALKNSEGLKESHSAVFEGFELIHKKLSGTLSAMGLKPLISVGQVFDAEIHEAVTKVPAPSEDMKGKVVDELESGYLLNDKVIRFAKVVVGE